MHIDQGVPTASMDDHKHDGPRPVLPQREGEGKGGEEQEGGENEGRDNPARREEGNQRRRRQARGREERPKGRYTNRGVTILPNSASAVYLVRSVHPFFLLQ